MYDHRSIEKKWQKLWEQSGINAADDGSEKPKFYSLETFPYPSAAGLHVGHPEGYTAEDIHARYRRMRGDNVLYTMGWDAFGLPTENYAIKVGKNPKEVAAENIENFRRQVKMLGFSYDWSREINTSDPTYYRWTQWLFLQLYKHGLAYRAEAPVNWCESCKTVLANEQVEDGVGERCKNPVTQRQMLQWFLKITPYAERLLDGLEKLDWPESTKIRQRNWVGKSQGVNFKCTVKNLGTPFEVYDSVPQTFRAQTFIAIAPEHPMVIELVRGTPQETEVMDFVRHMQQRKAAKRFEVDKDIEGIFTGRYADDPFGTGDLPIWVSSFVLVHYGSGVVSCSAHDTRDFAFAKKYGIPLRPVMFPSDTEEAEKVRNLEVCFAKDPDGILEQPAEFKGMRWEDAREPIIRYIEKKKLGKRATQYKLRDWLVSRQRYWGAPIPIIHCPACGVVPVPEEHLPVLLPDDVDFRPTGEPPLARSTTFHDVRCPQCGKKARRESETLDTFVDSSWYFFRYTDPHNEKEFASREKIHRWLPVDLYIIGAEHTVLHLLYARFITKVLHDLNYIDFEEPFLKLRHIGLILGDDNQKMSKSRGNVVNPDAVVEEFGADSLRMYEMFMGPLEDAKPWQTNGIRGIKRFLDRVFTFGAVIARSEATKQSHEQEIATLPSVARNDEILRALHHTIKKLTDDIESFHYNTAVSQLMVMLHAIEDAHDGVDRKMWETYLTLLAPFAPHISEELWERLGHTKSIFLRSWPSYDYSLLETMEVSLVIQVNGRVRAILTVPVSLTQDKAEQLARENVQIKKWLEGREVVKTIYVQDKILNFVLQ